MTFADANKQDVAQAAFARKQDAGGEVGSNDDNDLANRLRMTLHGAVPALEQVQHKPES